jgi:hypothetical protein
MEAAIQMLHNSCVRCCMIVTGAGASAIAALTSVPGCSRTLIDAQVPYFPNATVTCLDSYPKRFLSASVGAELAQLAYHRCRDLYTEETALARSVSAPPASFVAAGGGGSAAAAAASSHAPSSIATVVPYFVGVGCTAAINTERARRGEDAVFVTCWHAQCVQSYTMTFPKAATRAEQERGVCALIIFALTRCDHALAAEVPMASLGLPHEGPLRLGHPAPALEALREGMPYLETVMHCASPLHLLLERSINHVIFNAHGIPRFGVAPHSVEHRDHELASYLLVPGSFAPLHVGHLELARVASKVIARRDAARAHTATGSSVTASLNSSVQDIMQALRDDDADDTPSCGELASVAAASASSAAAESSMTAANRRRSFNMTSTARALSGGSGGGSGSGGGGSSGAAGPLVRTRRVVVTFEISATIVGKGDVSEAELVSRTCQFLDAKLRVAVTRASLFVEKARIFPGHGLVVGIDTAERVLDPKYYDNSEEKLCAVLTEIRALRCYFVVGGRLKQTQPAGPPPPAAPQPPPAAGAQTPTTAAPPAAVAGSSFGAAPSGAHDPAKAAAAAAVKAWFDSSSLRVPAGFEDMFVPLPQSEFRVDISSTEIRARRADAGVDVLT